MLFATTPDVFKTYTNLLDITSGWLVRFLFFTPDYEKEWKGYRKETVEDITLRDDVRRSLELIKLRVDNYSQEKDFELSDEATTFFTKWQKRTETEAVKNKDRNKLRILGRLHTYAIKLSMLFTLGDENETTTISKQYMEVACRVIEEYFLITACNLLEDISRDEKHNIQDKIIGILKTYGKVTVRDILRYTHRPKKEIAEALEALDERGSYEIKKSESGKTVYYELNGTKSKKTNVASVTGVTGVTNVTAVTDIQRNNATVVTDENNTTVKRHSNGSSAHSFLCDSSDKRDVVPVGDSSDSQDKPSNGNGSQPDFVPQLQTFARYYQEKHGPINSANKTAFSMEFCKLNEPKYKNGTLVQPSEIDLVVSRLFKLTPGVVA